MKSGSSGSYDRHIYLSNSGQVVFGTYPGYTATITSPNSYNNNVWHHVLATQSGEGMKLYVDGALVGTDGATTAPLPNGASRRASGRGRRARRGHVRGPTRAVTKAHVSRLTGAGTDGACPSIGPP